MKPTQGTPKTLFEAIENAVREIEGSTTHPGIGVIEAHVRDFLGQRFTAAMMGNKTLTDLWASIIERPKE